MKDDAPEDAPPTPLPESAAKLLSDWREILCRLVDEAETFTREKPGVGLGVAFVAGAFLSSFFRKR
jgi:ElaB/YqjD/DUF883 family membrane-anchored ribosome-binding protein